MAACTNIRVTWRLRLRIGADSLNLAIYARKILFDGVAHHPNQRRDGCRLECIELDTKLSHHIVKEAFCLRRLFIAIRLLVAIWLLIGRCVLARSMIVALFFCVIAYRLAYM